MKHFSSLASKEQTVSLKTCGKFYAANNKKSIYRNGTADGITVNLKYLDTNPSASNKAIILAIHGAPGTYNDFKDLIERLHGKGYRVIAPNFPNMKLTDETRTFYHSPGEKHEVLKDFLSAIDVSSLDLAFMHSGGTYTASKLWNDNPGLIKSMVWINPPGHRRPRAMKPLWFVYLMVKMNLTPVGRRMYRNLGSVFSKFSKVKMGSPEDMDNAILSCFTLYFSGYERLAQYAAKIAATETPFSFFYSDRDKLVETEIFQELVHLLGASEENVNIASRGAIVKGE